MKQESGQTLSAVFVDYDNIYLSLKRKNEEAAKRFAKDANVWLKEIESGRLITPTNKLPSNIDRRIVLNRCYGNPVPRRNQQDNSTDMNSFPFIRHHFLRAGFEIVDCPPLTAQLKNSSDIRMVMDVRDFLNHDTRFEEFVILSGDADFTPVLHRLRAHARRTVVFANDHTAAPYVAIADGEVRESDLISLILEGRISGPGDQTTAAASRSGQEALRQEIMAEVSQAVRTSNGPVPLEVLAERALRALGHEKTVGSNWAGAGSFRDLLVQSLPDGLKLADQPPYAVYDTRRQLVPESAAATHRSETSSSGDARLTLPGAAVPITSAALAPAVDAGSRRGAAAPSRSQQLPAAPARSAGEQPATAGRPQQGGPGRSPEAATTLQQSIARIHDASQAPPLSPPDYRVLFECLAQEITESSIQGVQTLANVANRARELGLELRQDDIRFVLDVVSEADPWFEQGASANLFAGRFRNFVVARCRSHGLNLTSEELDLIDAWFTAGAAPSRQPATALTTASQGTARSGSTSTATTPAQSASGGDRWWALSDSRQAATDTRPQPRQPSASSALSLPGTGGGSAALQPAQGDPQGSDEFPRIVRTRLRG